MKKKRHDPDDKKTRGKRIARDEDDASGNEESKNSDSSDESSNIATVEVSTEKNNKKVPRLIARGRQRNHQENAQGDDTATRSDDDNSSSKPRYGATNKFREAHHDVNNSAANTEGDVENAPCASLEQSSERNSEVGDTIEDSGSTNSDEEGAIVQRRATGFLTTETVIACRKAPRQAHHGQDAVPGAYAVRIVDGNVTETSSSFIGSSDISNIGSSTTLHSKSRSLRLSIPMAAAIESKRNIPRAPAYKERPPIYKRKPFLVSFALAIVCLVGIVVGVGVGVTHRRDSNSFSSPTAAFPTQTPTSVSQAVITERFVALVGDNVLVPDTPEHKATDWILHEDPMNLDENAPSLDQRFLMALFYFFTTKESEWRTCGQPNTGENETCMFDALEVTFDRSESVMTSYTPVPAIRWLSGAPECDWVGIDCENNVTVIELELRGHNITGPLPTVLTKFPSLRSINLGFNEFMGSIPDGYSTMNALRSLDIRRNQLTGTVFPKFFKASHLVALRLGGNRLNGTLEGAGGLTLANMESLEYLGVSTNSFTGLVPTEIGELKNLTFVNVARNEFDQQPLPTELGKLSLLQTLRVDRNLFSGPIPTELGSLNALTHLRLSRTRMSGPIAEGIYELTKLERLWLAFNRLTGTLSSAISMLTDLQEIRIMENRLSGNIPSELGLLMNLERANLHSNLFTGSMPMEVCDIISCDHLGFVTADCTEPDPLVSCPCCSACCERISGRTICDRTPQFLNCPRGS